jgi:hypothetical protein
MKERRYSLYKQEDVFIQFIHFASVLKVEVLGGIVGASVSLSRLDTNTRLRAVVLARSSDWYHYSLNYPLWKHGCNAVVCGTHDSCLPVPVLALDAMKWYKKHEIRDIFGPLQPTKGPDDKPIPDTFDRARKSAYGHTMLIGALMCGRQDAIARLQTLPDRTRYRVEAELRKLHTRRQGRPLVVAPDPDSRKTKSAVVS